MNKKTQDVMFSSKNMEEVTPQDFFDQLNSEFRFNLDAAASKENTKCDKFYSEEMNALTLEWHGRVWCNPPYGRTIQDWVDHAAEQANKDWHATIVMLLPARTDTRWFGVCSETCEEIRFVRGRLKFSENKHSAPFPSMLAIWNIHANTRHPMRFEPYNYNLIWRRG